MDKIKNKLYNIISKIGKRNLILFFFVLIVLVITRLYNTFSLNTEIGESYINGIKTYEFILSNNKEDNSVTIPESSSKNISIKITNPDNVKLKYGLYYSSDDALTDVYLGSKNESKKEPQGLIDGKENYTVDLTLLNLSKHQITINFGVTYGLEKGGDLALPEDKEWINKYNGPVPLSEKKAGSYVFFEGNNGCNTSSCNGTNVKYLNENNKGHCYRDANTYKTSGWRIAYTRKNTVYLISAGAISCLSTDATGGLSTDEVPNYENDVSLTKHISNLNKEALKYCNRKYAYGNSCNNRSSWAMDVNDFKYMTSQILSSDKCFKQKNKTSCGYNNDLIDNGGYYWIANANNGTKNTGFFWDANERMINSSTTNHSLGLRPIIRLKEEVYAIDGKGTEKEPYLISAFNQNDIEEDVEVIDNTENKKVNIANYIKDLYKSSKEIETINLTEENETVKVNKDKKIMLDNNNIYRYYGENPKNYVMFNDELWRIISLSNIKTDKDDASGKERVKLIKAGSIGNYSYDSSKEEENSGEGSNNWSKSDLKKELNELYYNQTKGTCTNNKNKESIECDFSIIGLDSNARYLIDNALYYLSEDNTELEDVTPSKYYQKERTGKTVASKVGIIYGSDYMYAADLNICKETRNNYQNNSNCNNNWLYKAHVNVIGNFENTTPYNPREIYPVVYLKNNIVITDGKGTEDDPYIIEITE